MPAAAPIVAIRSDARLAVVPQLFDSSSIPPRLVARPAPAPTRRSKIWDFSTHLHCSIIGTCLSTNELRQILKKLGVATQGSTDHALHSMAVTLAGRHDDASRQLNKALDHRHKLAVHQFAKATSEAELRALWAEALRSGEIPGAYWATLTHAAATQAVIREAFGDVHMLSHLIGSANRADIRRLCQLEAEKAALEAKLHRQQAALHEAVVTRDARIAELRQALSQRVMTEQQDGLSDETAALRGLVRGSLPRSRENPRIQIGKSGASAGVQRFSFSGSRVDIVLNGDWPPKLAEEPRCTPGRRRPKLRSLVSGPREPRPNRIAMRCVAKSRR